MKYLLITFLCVSAVSSQYHGNGAHLGGARGGHQSSGGVRGSSHGGGYGNQQSQGGLSASGGHHRMGRSPQGYSRYGHYGSALTSGYGNNIPSTSAIGPVPVPPVTINGAQSGSRRYGRSIPVLPATGHIGAGRVSGGYSQGGLHGGYGHARSVGVIAPVVGHGSNYGLAPSSAGHLGSTLSGHGHRL